MIEPIVAAVIACAPVALYFLMHHNHDNGHCGWRRCQAGETTWSEQP